MNEDKAGADYWSKYWEVFTMPEPIRPTSKSINNYPLQLFHNYFKSIFGNESKGKKILEIGCGNSVWLPYFAKEFGLEIYGLDYSNFACTQTLKILARENVSGIIIERDFFDPPKEFLEKFDYVVSFGVIEHFSDTADVLERFKLYLKPNGLLITNIPNMTGLTGWWQKTVNRAVYDIHVPLSAKMLYFALSKAGYKNIKAQYLLSVGVFVTVEGDTKPRFLYFKRMLSLWISRITKIFWFFEMYFFPLPTSRLLSPIIISIAQK